MSNAWEYDVQLLTFNKVAMAVGGTSSMWVPRPPRTTAVSTRQPSTDHLLRKSITTQIDDGDVPKSDEL